MSNNKKPLWLAVRFLDFNANALGITDLSSTFIIEDKRQILYISPSTQKKGVNLSTDITTAKVLSQCHVYSRNLSGEEKFLNQIADLLYQFTPYIKLQKHLTQGGVTLEISQSLTLFGGIQPLVSLIEHTLTETKYRFNLGLGHSEEASWILSHQVHHPSNHQTIQKTYLLNKLEDTNSFIEQLYCTPIECLLDFSHYSQDIKTLQKSGFKYLSDIHRHIQSQSINSLRARLSQGFIEFISKLLITEDYGRQSNLFSNPKPQHIPYSGYSDTIQFDTPVNHTDQLKPAIVFLLEKFEIFLKTSVQETEVIQWRLSDIYHNDIIINIACDSPQTEGKILLQLTYIKLDNISIAFEVDQVELTCSQFEHSSLKNHTLFSKKQHEKNIHSELSLTFAKLKTFLGENNIYKLSYTDSYIPEHSQHRLPPSEKANQSLPVFHAIRLRPTWLFTPPIEIARNNNNLYWNGKIILLSSSERIENNWWGTPIARNYYLAQREDNLRIWVYQDIHQRNWYVHGAFS